MKLLYVVQRYGEEVLGGSETACRMFAEHLVSRGHEVDVLTSCALSYVDWANEFPPGVQSINGVRVVRLPVIEPRIEKQFALAHGMMLKHPRSSPLFDQQRWARVMGPNLEGITEWLLDHGHEYDVVIFMTYLYATATVGLPAVSGRVPTILQPTAHDEPMAYFGLFHSLFRMPDAFIFFTPEEKETVSEIYQLDPVGPIAGIGIDLPDGSAVPEDFRRAFPGVSANYLIYVGRLDVNKGVDELISFFVEYRRKTDQQVDLVLAGAGPLAVADHPFIHTTGFLSETMKSSAIAGARALIQPSYYESFSIVLCEAWAQARPAMVQEGCEVLRGQALRSGGAIPYGSFAEFKAGVELLLAKPDVSDLLGRNGRRYVESQYDWEQVVDKVEEAAEIAIRRFEERRLRTTPLR